MFPRRIVQSLQLYTYLEAEGDAVAEELPDHDEALPRARVPAMSSGRACVSVVGHIHVVRGIHDTNPIAARVPSRLEPPRSPHTHPFTVSKPFHHSCKEATRAYRAAASTAPSVCMSVCASSSAVPAGPPLSSALCRRFAIARISSSPYCSSYFSASSSGQLFAGHGASNPAAASSVSC